jgi:acetylornithine deacetylase/succinyl-diaminopimelate desuccinylase-like protein
MGGAGRWENGLVTDPATAPGQAYDPAAEVVDLCRDLIRIDTSNPGDNSGPGERAAAELVAEMLEEVGIHAELYEPAPRRTSVLARWGDVPGSDAEPLLVHGHLDVVPADAADWQVDPFSGEIADGCVWGRGAVDMKDFDAIALSVIRARARAGVMPSRPLVLAFTADEEAGSTYGAGPLLQDRREWLEDCRAAVGEVGGFSTTVRDQRIYLIQAAEKGMAWMRLTAHGTAGHGSMRNTDNAVTRLAAAVARIGSYAWPVRLTPAMEVLLAAVGDIAEVQVTPENAADLVEEFGPAARMLSAVIRNSATPTMLEAGYKVNVVPGKAVAHVDGRFLPGHEDEFFATLRELIGEGVDMDFVTHQHAVETSFSGHVPDAIVQALLAEDPEARVLPYLMPGGTDGKQWSKLGIACYGFAPLRLPPDLDFTALFHGIDERVPVDALEFGARVFDRFLDVV